MELKTSTGIKIKIEKTPFAKGGEGAVHRILSPISHTHMCAKIYFPKARTPSRQKKIEFMIKAPPSKLKSHNHIVCWPVEVLLASGEFSGFTMPLAFDQSIQLYELCTTKLKAKLEVSWHTKFDRESGVGVQSRLKLCTNLAAAIHSIHSMQNYVLVDMKPQNILVTDGGKVSIIDCDSIQIAQNGRVIFPAPVATPEYIPPEGANINPTINVVNQTWDRFSMAIMFYEVIFGLHPYAASFSGRFQDSVTIDSKIKDGLFVHGKNKVFLAVLPSLHKNFGVIPQKLKQLFIRAFDSGHRMPDVRPTAEEWGLTIFTELKRHKTVRQPNSSSNTLQKKPQKYKSTQKTKKQITTPKLNKPGAKLHTTTTQITPVNDGIGVLFLLYLLFPIGFLMMFIYYADGKTKKGNQALLSAIFGFLLFLGLT